MAGTDTMLSVDCFRPTPTQQVVDAVKAHQDGIGTETESTTETERKALGKFTHYRCLTLPHLLALVLRPSSSVIPADVSVVVLDSLTALVNSALPKPTDGKANGKGLRGKLLYVRS